MSTSLPTAGTSTEMVEDDAPRPGTLRLLLRNPVSLAGVVVLLLVVLAAVLGPALAPYGANDTDVTRALQGPSGAHWFGTDDLGRDQLSRVLIAARVSMEVALVSVGISLVVGVGVGLVSGYLGGVTDGVLMRVVDVLFAFPVLLLALAIVAVLGPGLGSAMIAIGVVYTPIFARVARASTLSVRSEPYVQASRTMGTGNAYVVWHHVLPNISGPVIVQTSLSLAFAILSEAALSFLGLGNPDDRQPEWGLGVQPPRPSWGRMLFDAQDFVGVAWWMSVFPGLAILLTTLAFNLVGDGLGQVLDPKRRTALAAQAGGRR